jgi:hypothetical protein
MWWSWLLVGCGAASSRSRIPACTLTMSAMAVLTILCPGAPGSGRALGESAALYALNAPARRRSEERVPRWQASHGGAMEGAAVVAGSGAEEEEAMTASIACAIAASSASELGNGAWPPYTGGSKPCCSGRSWWEEEGSVAVVVIERTSEEYSGLPMEMDGSEEDEDDGGVICISSSSSDCWTWSATAAAEVSDDSPTSISPLSQPMNTAVCATTSISISEPSSSPFMQCDSSSSNQVIKTRTFVPASCLRNQQQSM